MEALISLGHALCPLYGGPDFCVPLKRAGFIWCYLYVLQLGSTNRSNFGLNGDGYVFGYLKNATIKSKKFLHMISGAGWLVRKYTIHAYILIPPPLPSPKVHAYILIPPPPLPPQRCMLTYACFFLSEKVHTRTDVFVLLGAFPTSTPASLRRAWLRGLSQRRLLGLLLWFRRMAHWIWCRYIKTHDHGYSKLCLEARIVSGLRGSVAIVCQKVMSWFDDGGIVIILAQVDGEEDVSAGLDLVEFSEVLVQFGAWQAVVSVTGAGLFKTSCCAFTSVGHKAACA